MKIKFLNQALTIQDKKSHRKVRRGHPEALPQLLHFKLVEERNLDADDTRRFCAAIETLACKCRYSCMCQCFQLM